MFTYRYCGGFGATQTLIKVIDKNSPQLKPIKCFLLTD